MNKFFVLFLFLFSIMGCNETQDSLDSSVKKKPVSEVNPTRLEYSLDVTHTEDSKVKATKIHELARKLHKSKQFNGNVLVVENNNIILKESYGYSDFASKDLLTDTSSFHLASVSKQFTAMAIMILEERDKLDFDVDIKTFFPDIPYNGITVRNLLNHTSGLANITNYVPHFLSYWDSCEVATNEDLIFILKTQNPRLRFKPGTRFSYNNTGYVLLALIIEKVSGKSYKDFLRENIFIPLGMNQIGFFDEYNPKINFVKGYGLNRKGNDPDRDDVRNGFIGEKGICSSTIDLYKWDRALYTDVLVKEKTLKEAFSKSELKNGNKINYGFGWRKSKKDSQIVYHFGHWQGFTSCIIRFTDDNNTIIILNNTSSKRVKFLAVSIMKILYSNSKEVPDL